MFPPSPSDELQKKIKELIDNIKTTLEITISKEVEKTLTTIELILDDNADDNDNSDSDSDSDSDSASDSDSDDEQENKKIKDYYFEDSTFKIKKSFIENDEKKNKLKAVVFNYILKNINDDDSSKILEKLMNRNNNNNTSWFSFWS
jgi:hypothetical protein